MRAELDAAFFHLYGIERDDVDYIMDSFRAFQNKDRATLRPHQGADPGGLRRDGRGHANGQCRTRRFSTRRPDTALAIRNETF